MSSAVPPSSKVPSRRGWRRFGRRLALIGLALLMLAVVFHRPLLHGLIRVAVPLLAVRAGLEARLSSSGSLWYDLVLSGIQVSGGERHWLPEAEVHWARAEYDLGALWRGDWARAVRGLALSDAALRVDLRHLPSAGEALSTESAQGRPPPLVWPEEIDLDGVSAEVTLADGSLVRVAGLRLRQPAVGEGELGWSELAWTPAEAGSAALLFPPVRAGLERAGRHLRLTALDLPYETRLELLTVDLDRFEEGMAALVLELTRASACLQAAGTVSGLWQGPLRVEAETRLTGLHARELAGLPLPAGWSMENLDLRLKMAGALENWTAMEAEAEASVEQVEMAGWARLDDVRVAARLFQGELQVEAMEARRGKNAVAVTAMARLGGKGNEFHQADWRAEVYADLPEVKTLLDERALPLMDVNTRAWTEMLRIGLMRASGSASGQGARVETARLEMTGADWGWGGYRWPTPGVEAELTGDRLRVRLPASPLGEGNRVSAEAALVLNEAMPLEASWRVECGSLSKLSAVTGLPVPAQPEGASLSVEGRAGVDLTALMEGEWEGLQGRLMVMARDLRWKVEDEEETPRGMESLELEMSVVKGEARVERGMLRLDAENEVRLTGYAGLAEPRAFEVEALVELPRLAALEPLLRPWTTVAPGAGELRVETRVRGTLTPWQCDGRVELQARQVAMPGWPHALDAEADAVFAGARADLSKLSVRAGPWSAKMRAAASGEWMALEELELSHEQSVLARGRLRYPFDLLRETEPGLADGGPLEWRLEVQDLAVAELLGALGVGGVPTGVLQASASLNGRLPDLVGKVETRYDGRAPLLAGLEPPMVKVVLSLSDGRLGLTAEVRQIPLETLTLEASMPFTARRLVENPAGLMEQPIEAVLRLPESRLDALAGLAPEWIRELPARLRLEAALAGTLASPRLTAEADLDCAEVVMAKPDLPSVREVVLRLRARDQEVRLEELSVLLAGGRLRAGGRVGIESLVNPELDLELSAQESLVFRDSGASLRANAALRCQGPLDAARLSGRVELVRGRYYKDIDVAPALRLPSDAPALPPDAGRAASQLELPPFLAGWQFAVDVVTRDPVLLSGNLINGAVSARAALGGTGAKPLLSGGASVDRMLLKLPFSLVKVTHGEVTLRPEHPFDPQIDVRAESRMPSHQVTIFANGPLSEVKTRFSATPPLSEADIAALLATGTTLSGDGAQVAAEAIVRALYLYVSEFYRKTFNKKKVIDETPPRFHFGFAPSGVGADRAVDAMQATYDFNDRWRLTGQFAPSGRVRAALGYLIRFGRTRSNPPAKEEQP